MTSNELVLLLPCNHWDDFPLELDGPQADSLLAAWTLLWVPQLLDFVGGIPGWQPAESPPAPDRPLVAILPAASRSALPVGWQDTLIASGGTAIDVGADDARLLDTAFKALDLPRSAAPAALDEDFRALGLAYLHIQLLTREMHYSSHLDETDFGETLQQAVRASLDGDEAAAAERVSRLFDMLVEARDHFYPVDAHLLDLTLLAPSTLGADLEAELAAADDPAVAINVVATGQVIERLAARNRRALTSLRDKLARGMVDLAGGGYAEAPLPTISPEAILGELLRGRETYDRYLSRSPSVYGSRHGGLGPRLPGILSQLGYEGALHMAFDGTRLPKAEQCKTRWEGSDGTPIDALSAPPMDASDAGSFLRLARRMSDSMDHDFVATVPLAHWPARASRWYAQLKRIARHGAVLGRFVTLEEYFQATETPDLASRFTADQYRSDPLSDAVGAGRDDPISGPARDFAATCRGAATERLATMGDLAASRVPDGEGGRSGAAGSVDKAAADVAARLGPVADQSPAGYLVLNPWTHKQRFAVGPETPPRRTLEVPGIGFAWASAGRTEPSRRRAADVPLAEDRLLRNEFFEVTVSGETGGIQAVFDYHRRGNRLSQQVAYRRPGWSGLTGPGTDDRQQNAHYSRMIADRIDVTSAGPVMGEITSSGRLVGEEDEMLARFEQRLRLVRGSRVIDLSIRLDPQMLPDGPPWENYYAARFAWPDGLVELARCRDMDRQPTASPRFEAPYYLERSVDGYRVAILACGHPYHRASGPRTCDTLLLVRGERARTFHLGIGFGLPHPLEASMALALRTPVVVESPCPAAGDRGWLLHVGAPNVVITACEVLGDAAPAELGSSEPGQEGQKEAEAANPLPRRAPQRRGEAEARGFRLRLLETEGRACRVHVRSFRNLHSARQTDLLGQPTGQLATEGDRLTIDLHAHQWVQVEAWW